MIIDIILSLLILVSGFFIYRIYNLFSRLSKGIESDLNKKGFTEVKKRLDDLENDGKKHIQKIGLVRFNPFNELGGDHSFSLAVLDNKESGIILTSLHTRDRTRIYMKEVVGGKSVYDLSKEEVKAIKLAKEKF